MTRVTLTDIVQASERAKQELAKPVREERERHDGIDWKGFAYPKPTTIRDRKYQREAARTHDCAIRGREDHRCGPKIGADKVLLDFAHVPTQGKRAMGKRASDRGGGIILCRFGHMLQHTLGWPRFQEKYRIDAIALARAVERDWQKRHGDE